MSHNTDHVLIVALSGRALARSAHAAAIPVNVLDVFCDTDMQAYANITGRIGNVSGGIDYQQLPELADELCPPQHCTGLVYGAGFEANPEVLAELCKARKLYGNEAEVMAAICSPKQFFATLEHLGVPYPDVRFQRPQNPGGWLAKRAGASGGAHVQPARRLVRQDGYYYQRKAPGRVMSVLFLANGHAADIVGVSEQWNAGIEDIPYAYGGALSHQRVSDSLYSDFRQLTDTLTRHWRLRGLNSVDLVVDGDDFKVLEVNARPTATAELYDCRSRESLFRQHLDACCGARLNYQYNSGEMHAHQLVYAERDLRLAHRISWPNWCSDRPVAGTRIRRGEPVCSVHASGASRFALNALLQFRSHFIQKVFASSWTSLVETGFPGVEVAS